VPTDFRRNAWLFAIVFGAVLIAWILAILWRRVPAEMEALQEPPVPQMGPIGPPPGLPPRRAARVAIARIVGSTSEVIQASPPLALESGGIPYRLARYFDVTKRADGFAVDQLIRLPDRWADQRALLPDPNAKEPAFRPAQEVVGLPAQERVAVVSVSGETRAYPFSTLTFAAGVHDDLGGKRVFVSWNRVTQAGSCLVARLSDRDLEWHDAGLVYRGNEVLYDAQSGALWDSFSGQALTGAVAGHRAERIALTVWPWDRWKTQDPTSQVMTARVSGTEAVAEEADRALEAYLKSPDVPVPTVRFRAAGSQIPAKAFVLGVAVDGKARAYPLTPLFAQGDRAFTDDMGGRNVEVYVTSPRTGYAMCEGKVLDATVMLWFAWQECYPETDIYQLRGESTAPPAGVSTPQPQLP